MPLTWNGSSVMSQIREAGARGILNAAIYLVNEHCNRVKSPNPMNYLGFGGMKGHKNLKEQDTSLTVFPLTVGEVSQIQKVSVGDEEDKSTLFWGVSSSSQRKSEDLQKTLQDIRGEMAQLVEENFTSDTTPGVLRLKGTDAPKRERETYGRDPKSRS